VIELWGMKIEWLKAVLADRDLNPRAKIVAAYLALENDSAPARSAIAKGTGTNDPSNITAAIRQLRGTI